MGGASLPIGTVSFLFTDIEGSTSLLQRVGDEAYRGILETHHRLVRAVFAQAGGTEVTTQGDAFFVAFARAREAVAAAIEAQRAIAGHPWPSEATVRVRMGIHTGEPTLGPGGYVGIDVHRAARICSAGSGGQILLSERAHALVRDDLPAGTGLRDLGSHRLKDLARPEHIYQVDVDGLPSEFPPITSLDVRPGNLPSLELTSFVGREQEVAQVKRHLSEARVVTLLGAGGAGKTRLCLEVAARHLEAFDDGVWLVELAPVVDAALIPQTVAAVLGLREAPGRSLLDVLIEHIKPRELLLVLDNCEHLIEGCAQLGDALLRACPRLRILASSREPLRVRGEMTFPVPPLALPDRRRGVTLDEVMRCDASRLFIERAVLSNPGFSATEANAQAVAEIVHRLDGIPLAIELAAARVKLLPAEQIARRLDDRFRLLTGGSRTGLPHHQTLRAAVDWSYDLLSDEERRLFSRLSVFAGGFTLAATEAVCARDGIVAEDVLDLLARLVDKSLVVTEILGREVRYRMLDTIHHYGRDRLQEAGEADVMRARHLRWAVDLAEHIGPELQGPDRAGWLEGLEQEHDNLRAALEWAGASGSHGEAFLRLAAALWPFWRLRGYLTEGVVWLLAALENDAGTASRPRAQALLGAADLTWRQGDYERAAQRAEAAFAANRLLGDASGEALALNIMGIAANQRGAYEEATALYEESLDLRRRVGDRRAVAGSLANLGIVARHRGDLGRAQALHEESLALRRELGDSSGVGSSLTSLGLVAFDQGDLARATALHEESLAIYRTLEDKSGIAIALANLGIVANVRGDIDQAGTLFRESLPLYRELSHREGIGWCLAGLAEVAARQGRTLDAARLFGAAEALWEAAGFVMPPSERRRYDAVVSVARAAVDGPAFERARAEGRAMTVDQAAELSLPSTAAD